MCAHKAAHALLKIATPDDAVHATSQPPVAMCAYEFCAWCNGLGVPRRGVCLFAGKAFNKTTIELEFNKTLDEITRDSRVEVDISRLVEACMRLVRWLVGC